MIRAVLIAALSVACAWLWWSADHAARQFDQLNTSIKRCYPDAWVSTCGDRNPDGGCLFMAAWCRRDPSPVPRGGDVKALIKRVIEEGDVR